MKRIVKKIAPRFLIGFYHFSLAFLGAFLYGFPSKKLTVIGVTGTNGKSTVVEMISKILDEAGFKTASLSSIKFKIAERSQWNNLKMTMPGRMKIQKFLSQAVKAGCKYAVLEVTSEGIRQFRHKFISFDAAVFTNLSPEHIESHGNFEKYKKAKAELFKAAKNIHVINSDDENAGYFMKIPAKTKIGYGMSDLEKLSPINLNLIGKFNIYNALAAIKMGMAYGISLEICKKALEKVESVPGRMEVVVKQPFTVIVDYAHNPAALEKAYKTVAEIKSQGANIIAVLGSCGGGRDKWKRSVLGDLAAQYCKEVIVANEDPYDENPLEIIEQVAKNIKAEKILDRREAIRRALQLAKPGDLVIITGKGCEPWMCVAGGKKIPWDDRQIVREEMKNLRL